MSKKNISQRTLAKNLNKPETTISSWMNKVDIKISNIQKVCEVLDIGVWQFFAPDDLVLPEYTPEQKQFFTAFGQLPEELQDKGLDILNAYLDAYIAGKEAKFR
ncbi:MAG: helix-turn-helix transcriptional regulator [Spirochaetes bacterium]|nr:helix-turn-helix transcriptional regulator [Spirochaetota bacterium]